MKLRHWLLIVMLVAPAACARPKPVTPQAATPMPHVVMPQPNHPKPSRPTAQTTFIAPTPNPTRTPPPEITEVYLVQAGDTLGKIAAEYGATIDQLMARNSLIDADNLHVGQPIVVPIQVSRVSPSFKITPDSELVYGPAYTQFDITAFVELHSGYLKSYVEKVDDQTLSGAQIVQLVAQHYSVGPRVLLALIEYQAGWVTRATLDAPSLAYPAGYMDAGRQGLYKQLAWAADHLNDGYYGWTERGYSTVRFGDGTRARIAPGLNAGTVGIQTTLALTLNYDAWQTAAGPQGFYATYISLFGDPFAYAVEPLLPADLAQPPLRLPWSDGDTWYYTGGPHGGWGSGSAWAAIDFTPPGEGLGCYDSNAWVTAVSSGLVAHSDNGAVIVDLDDDGFEQTGWTIFYLHISSQDRVAAGTRLQAGDRIGYPSCEGGFSNGTHVHIARRYNGQWIAADGSMPLVLSGWRAVGTLSEYDGTLINGNMTVEACECREAKNGLSASPE